MDNKRRASEGQGIRSGRGTGHCSARMDNKRRAYEGQGVRSLISSKKGKMGGSEGQSDGLPGEAKGNRLADIPSTL